MKGAGTLVVQLRGVNFGFRSHLGCSGKNAIIFSRKGLFQGCTKKFKRLYIFNWFYLLDSCIKNNQSFFRCQKKVGSRPDWFLKEFNSKVPTNIPAPFIWETPRGRFATKIFNATQRCNIVATLFRIVTALFQHCNDVLR